METDTFYFFYKHQFGQWAFRSIVDSNGIVYSCCEQYMMFHKAMLFKDTQAAEDIMLADYPADQQRIGRKVKGFDQETWDENKALIVFQGNLLKFTQHQDLRERLLKTGDKILVEASPVDRVWGVGLDADDYRILDPMKWRGQNLLGKVLMQVRYWIDMGL